MLMTWCPLCTGCGQANVHCPNMRFGAGGLLPNWPYRSVGLVHWSLNVMSVVLSISPNPPKDTDGRREDSGRGWVRELQGRWPGILG